jgi:hypothetical protein
MPGGNPGTIKRDEGRITAVISGVAAGRLIGRSASWVTRLSTSGWIPRVDGGYRICDVVQGLIKYKDNEDRRANKSVALRLTELKVRKLELDNARRERELVPADDAIAVVDLVCGSIRTHLGGLPARYTRDLMERRRLGSEIDRCLSAVSADLAKAMELLKNGST